MLSACRPSGGTAQGLEREGDTQVFGDQSIWTNMLTGTQLWRYVRYGIPFDDVFHDSAAAVCLSIKLRVLCFEFGIQVN